MTAVLKPHPYADLFPMMEGEAFDTFAADCAKNGIREKIVLLDGLILDGRNRYQAAVRHGLPAAQGDADAFREFDPAAEGDPLEWVLSRNLHRRHLDEGQRSIVAARLEKLRHGGARQPVQDANLHLELAPPPPAAITRAEAARRMNVSPRSVADAKKVLEKGAPELVAAVDHGKLAVSAAAKAVALAPERQKEVARLAEDGKANVARTVLKKAERDVREAVLGARQQQLPDKRYGFILADPEHRFEVWSRETGLDRSPDNHYPTSSQAEIEARDVASIAAADSGCALWCTDLARGIRILEAWGFTFKSYFVWVKDIVPAVGYSDSEIDFFASAFGLPREKVAALVDGHERRGTFVTVGAAGTGYWNRDRDEILLIGTRGNFVAPAMGTQPESVIFAARPKQDGQSRGRHSAKPDAVHRWIEENWPHLPKIELNARQARPGWDIWGLEAPEQESTEPSNRAAGADGEAYPEAGPQAEASHAGTGIGALADHDGITAAGSPAADVSAGVTAGETAPVQRRGAADAVARLVERSDYQTGPSAGNPPAETAIAQKAPEPDLEIPAFLRRPLPAALGGGG